ncbi:MAG: HEAT repeat domain-containing protein [Planctomycetota bacterium]|jgi:hypothetical protein
MKTARGLWLLVVAQTGIIVVLLVIIVSRNGDRDVPVKTEADASEGKPSKGPAGKAAVEDPAPAGPSVPESSAPAPKTPSSPSPAKAFGRADGRRRHSCAPDNVWAKMARTDLQRALQKAREALDAGPDWHDAGDILKGLAASESKEAVALILEYMTKHDVDFDFAHRAEVFFEALGPLPPSFAPMIGPAATRKVQALIEDGDISWNTIQGYAKLAGRFSSAEEERFLKQMYEGKLGDDSDLIKGGYLGLVEMNDPGVVDYLWDSKSDRAFTSVSEMDPLMDRQGERVLQRMRTGIFEDVPPNRKETAARLLGRHGGARDVDFLADLAIRSEPGYRELAVQGLGEIETFPNKPSATRAVGSIIQGLQDADASVRRSAYYAVEYNDLYKTRVIEGILRTREQIEEDRSMKGGARDALRETRKFLKKQEGRGNH